MIKFSTIAAMTLVAGLAAGCQTGQDSAATMNKQNFNSKVDIGSLSCHVSGSSGYIFGSTKDLSCVYTTKDGVEQAYEGKIRKFGLDIGHTKSAHLVWKVYQLGGLVGGDLSSDPKVLTGDFIGEQASISADASIGGNWLYGGANKQIVIQATQLQDDKDVGYNLAYGIAEIGLTLKK